MLAFLVAPLRDERDVRAMLAALVAGNVHYLRTRRLPALYGGSIVYRREARSDEGRREWWATAPVVASRGFGDCEDLACYRAAELQLSGDAATVEVIKFRSVWHIVVRRADGSIEDPSRLLGMTGDA